MRLSVAIVACLLVACGSNGGDAGDADMDVDVDGDVDSDVDVDTDADGDTDTDADDCSAADPCVPYQCFCGECTQDDMRCEPQSWANANGCMLGCMSEECPAYSCSCDSLTGACVRE